MGKKSKKKKLKKQVNGDVNLTENGDSKMNYSVPDLMERVDQYVESFDFELAYKFCQKALELEPNNTNVIEVTGNVCAEQGELEKAKQYFLKAVKLEPDIGHIKYLYLGQISEGQEAVKYFNNAINILKLKLESILNNTKDPGEKQMQQRSINTDISNVYCSLAEIYMTDCCMEEDAQKLCEYFCKQAIATNDKNPDSYIVTCNFLLSCNDMVQAKESALKLYDLWRSLTESQQDNIPTAMSYECRVSLIKVLIEIEYFDKVYDIVDQLIEENEDDIRIWYYLGLAKYFLLQADKNNDNPRFYLEKALELFEKTGYEDDDMKTHIEEMLGSCPAEEELPVIMEEEDEILEDEDMIED